MKPSCATFSDSRHAVQTTKISFPTQSTTENWTTKSWHFIEIIYTIFLGRFSEKVHATIPKGIVGGFEGAVLQRNLKE